MQNSETVLKNTNQKDNTTKNWEMRKAFGLLLWKFKKDVHIELSNIILREGMTILTQNAFFSCEIQ